MLPIFTEFFDVGFLRLLWALFVQYLVATGFLLPEQQSQWEQGWGHIISVAGTVIFIAIWQWHAHKKDVTKVIEKTETVVTPTAGFFQSIVKKAKSTLVENPQ